MSDTTQEAKNTVKTEVDLRSIPDAVIEREYNRCFGKGVMDYNADTILTVYRLIAMGQNVEAMEEMAREFSLTPPSHERAIADLLSHG